MQLLLLSSEAAGVPRTDAPGPPSLTLPPLPRSLGPKALQGSVELIADILDPAVSHATFTGDPYRVRQALLNVCDNAVRHAPEDGEVVIRVMLADDDGASAEALEGALAAGGSAKKEEDEGVKHKSDAAPPPGDAAGKDIMIKPTSSSLEIMSASSSSSVRAARSSRRKTSSLECPRAPSHRYSAYLREAMARASEDSSGAPSIARRNSDHAAGGSAAPQRKKSASFPIFEDAAAAARRRSGAQRQPQHGGRGERTVRLRFEVEDNGSGFNPEKLESAFTPFQQARASCCGLTPASPWHPRRIHHTCFAALLAVSD